jgi:class 3 adenylate cyclase/tetratricopeptide (TPR) repeat protein
LRCSRCRADNPAGMKFCGQCGAPLEAVCRSCGAANPLENRFCGRCGASLDGLGLQDSAGPEPYTSRPRTAPVGTAKGMLPGEMKQVSVLFCDIVNSTPLTERLGPEAMRDLVSAFLETSLAEVHRYGGTAPQFTGDGFLALFGAPVTHEDHVRRALLAAVAIRRALSGDDETGARERLNLPVRIGIHSGPVIFGSIGDRLPMDHTVIGDTANVAARLQQAADPGTILLSEATRLLAQGFAQVEPVGPLALKGKAEPILAYRLLGVSHRRAGLRESTPARMAAFVNRESELAILNNFLQQVENGRGQMLGIVGEPGIGKSRLVAEFRRQIGQGRVSWVEGRCLSYGTQIPYLLALDLLRSNWGIGEADPPEAIGNKVRLGLQAVGMDPDQDGPVLLHLLEIKDVDGSPALSNPEMVKEKAFEILRQLSIKASLGRPLVLVLEDLHWVDRVSEEFLGVLAENIRDARILLLATYRPGYRPPWIDKSYAGQTPVQPLSRDDSIHMVRSMVRAERIVELVTEEIVAKADGNPFFLEQLALHAGEARDLRSDLMVPNTIHDVVMARIDRLPDETKQLLQTASVIGREFSLRVLRAVWKGAGSLESQLRELSHLEFVFERVETEGTIYVFRHALTQETAYGSLLERHRRAYHGAVGQALEKLYAERTDEVAELLALHFGRSDEHEKSVDYAILAAEKSQRRWANREALSYFNDALHRLDLLPDSEANRLRRIDAVIKQGDGKFALGEHAEYVQALDHIRDLVEQSDDPGRRATWHYWRGWSHLMTGGQPHIAIDHCNKAAELAATAGLEEVKAYAESCLAQAYLPAGRLREAIEAGERALASFESLGNLWWAVRTISALSPAALALGEWNRSLKYCRRAIEHGTTLNDVRQRVIGLWRLGLTYSYQGDPERGAQYCSEALALGPLPYDAATAKAARGYAEIRAGRVDAGIADLREAVAWLDSSNLRFPRWRFSLLLSEGHLRRGDCAAARSLAEGVLEQTRGMGYLHFEGVACWLMGECLAPEEPGSAEPYVENAMDILGRIGARNDLARAMVTRATLRQAAGDFETARALLDQAHAIFQALGTLDEPLRVESARTALDQGAPIGLLDGTSVTPRRLTNRAV